MFDSHNRRHFLASTAAASAALLFGRNSSAFPSDAGGAHPGLIMREKQPLNLEFPFSTLSGPITPTNQFYVRNHFAIPQIDVATWRLKIDGNVERQFELSLDDLKNLPSKTIPATLECAGNGRAFLVPKAKGLLWEHGAVGNAEWTGVPLSAVLEKAGVKADTVEVVLEGADKGEVNDEPKSPGTIAFERSLPIEKAKKPEVLLAYRMNGEDLTVEHGFPLRVIVPGWFGMASIKWLTRITATATPFKGFWQTIEYSYFERVEGRPVITPLTKMQVKASIARPVLSENVPAGKPYRVFGAAWAGESNVAKVDLSADGGKSWEPAKLVGDTVPFSWRAWEFEWNVPRKAGRYHLMARATDDAGNQQPIERNKDRRNYMINQIVPVDVNVRPA